MGLQLQVRPSLQATYMLQPQPPNQSWKAKPSTSICMGWGNSLAILRPADMMGHKLFRLWGLKPQKARFPGWSLLRNSAAQSWAAAFRTLSDRRSTRRISLPKHCVHPEDTTSIPPAESSLVQPLKEVALLVPRLRALEKALACWHWATFLGLLRKVITIRPRL